MKKKKIKKINEEKTKKGRKKRFERRARRKKKKEKYYTRSLDPKKPPTNSITDCPPSEIKKNLLG